MVNNMLEENQLPTSLYVTERYDHFFLLKFTLECFE